MKVEDLKIEKLSTGEIVPRIGSIEATAEELKILREIVSGLVEYMKSWSIKPKVNCEKRWTCTDSEEKCADCANNKATSHFKSSP